MSWVGSLGWICFWSHITLNFAVVSSNKPDLLIQFVRYVIQLFSWIKILNHNPISINISIINNIIIAINLLWWMVQKTGRVDDVT